jgi:hypothetical protein
MRGPELTLVTYFAPKIKLTTFFNQLSGGFSVRFEGYFTMHEAETVPSIQKLSWHNESCLRTVIGCNTLQRSNTYSTSRTKPGTQLTKQCPSDRD